MKDTNETCDNQLRHFEYTLTDRLSPFRNEDMDIIEGMIRINKSRDIICKKNFFYSVTERCNDLSNS